MKLRKLALLLALLPAIGGLAACGGNTTTYKIGICQLAKHDALDKATQGFKDALIAELGEKNVTFDYQEAAGDVSICSTIINSFVSKNYNLIMANATPALQAAANATTTIPVLGTSITEYGVALGIDNFSGTTGINVSGTSDLAPLNTQGEMIIELFPNATKVGLFYCSAEANSQYQIDVVKAYLDEHGIETRLFSFSGLEDVRIVMESAASFSDVIYIPTDNVAADSAEIINAISRETNTPVFAGEENLCGNCGTFTLSISYYQIGYKTGLMAAQILRDGADVSKMPIAYDPNPVKKYNEENCEFFNLVIPEGFEKIQK